MGFFKGFGGAVGKKASNYNSGSKSGSFFVNEQMVLEKNNEWSTQRGSISDLPFTSVAQADTDYDNGRIIEGAHWFKLGTSHTAEQLYYKRAMYNDTVDYGMVRVFICTSNTSPTEEKLNNDISFNYILVGKKSGATTGVFGNYGFVESASAQLYNTNTAGFTGTSRNWGKTGNYYNGPKVMFGGGGAHGIYATNQNSCSWGSASGAIGAGWDGSTCGGYPSTMRLGLGGSANANYNVGGTFEFWVR
jgi:hypothetical protein